jgi:hypothetical protein
MYDRHVEAKVDPTADEAGIAAPRNVPEPWRRGCVWEVAFGILLPFLCLGIDPGIFRDDLPGTGFLAGVAVAAYAFILPMTVLSAAWLAWRRAPLLFGGPLLAGGLVALGIGIVRLPLSVPASFVLIGLAGFIPFGTGIVFLREGSRARREALAVHGPARTCTAAAMLAAAVLAVPLILQAVADHRTRDVVEAALAGNAEREARAISRLKPFGWLAYRWPAKHAFRSTSDPATRERLERDWRAATGRKLEVWR